MNAQNNALLGTLIPLFSITANALPHTYFLRQGSQADYARGPTQIHVQSPTSELEIAFIGKNVDLDLSAEEPAKGGAVGQCFHNCGHTYFSKVPLQGEATVENPIVLEDCDSSNTHQARVAYLRHSDVRPNLSPTSILVGCTRTTVNPFSSAEYESFLSKVPDPSYLPLLNRRDSREAEGESEHKLYRRWETRSDIDQYSDGYHTCKSAPSASARCQQVAKDNTGPQLEKAFHERFGSDDDALEQTNANNDCTSLDAREADCAGSPPVRALLVQGLTQEGSPGDSLKTDIAQKKSKGEGQSTEKCSIEPAESKIDEHSEFMRRWLAGDEHPRAFLTRALLQSKVVELKKEKGGEGEEGHKGHDDAKSCSSASDEEKPGCKLQRVSLPSAAKGDLILAKRSPMTKRGEKGHHSESHHSNDSRDEDDDDDDNETIEKRSHGGRSRKSKGDSEKSEFDRRSIGSHKSRHGKSKNGDSSEGDVASERRCNHRKHKKEQEDEWKFQQNEYDDGYWRRRDNEKKGSGSSEIEQSDKQRSGEIFDKEMTSFYKHGHANGDYLGDDVYGRGAGKGDLKVSISDAKRKRSISAQISDKKAGPARLQGIGRRSHHSDKSDDDSSVNEAYNKLEERDATILPTDARGYDGFPLQEGEHNSGQKGKRDLANKVWRSTVMPLIRRREARSQSVFFEREVV